MRPSRAWKPTDVPSLMSTPNPLPANQARPWGSAPKMANASANDTTRVPAMAPPDISGVSCPAARASPSTC